MAAGVAHWKPDPQWAAVSLRASVTVNLAREYRNTAREFATWWADVATLAVVAAATGQRLSSIRVAAADPTILMGEEDLLHLPAVPDDVRALTRLSASMAVTPLAPGRSDHDMAALAHDHAARAGLRISYVDGEVSVHEEGTAEARRRRLWGDVWIELRIPEVPAPDELADLLSRCDAPASVITAAVEATGHVHDAAASLLRVRELDDDEDDSLSSDEFDALWEHADQLTALLGQYARTLTGTLQGLPDGGDTP
jgi:hypothetical protein